MIAVVQPGLLQPCSGAAPTKMYIVVNILMNKYETNNKHEAMGGF